MLNRKNGRHHNSRLRRIAKQQKVRQTSEVSNFPSRNIDINENLARQLVVAQFPQWADLPIKPVEFGGWDNRTFHLGENMSVRLPSAECYAAQVEKEQHWLPKLAPFLPLPIPVPSLTNTFNIQGKIV